MNVKRVRQWARILRSPDISQGRSRLKRQTVLSSSTTIKHCCLGLACEFYSNEVGGYWTMAPDSSNTFAFTFDFAGSMELQNKNEYFPDPVRIWLGLPVRSQKILANLNDDLYSFKQISRYLFRQAKKQVDGQKVVWRNRDARAFLGAPKGATVATE